MTDIRLTGFGREQRSRRKESAGEGGDTILKFSGLVPGGAGTVTSFLTDGGSDAAASSTPPRYPLPFKFKVYLLTCNLLGGATPPFGGSVICQLVRNGVLVPGFTITYEPGLTGVGLTTHKRGITFDPGDTLGLAMIATGFSGDVGAVSAMLSSKKATACCDVCKNNCTFDPFNGTCHCPPPVPIKH